MMNIYQWIKTIITRLCWKKKQLNTVVCPPAPFSRWRRTLDTLWPAELHRHRGNGNLAPVAQRLPAVRGLWMANYCAGGTDSLVNVSPPSWLNLHADKHQCVLYLYYSVYSNPVDTFCYMKVLSMYPIWNMQRAASSKSFAGLVSISVLTCVICFSFNGKGPVRISRISSKFFGTCQHERCPPSPQHVYYLVTQKTCISLINP